MVDEVTRYTATAHRAAGWWIVQCDQHPGALSQVRRLDQAASVHREAIAFVVGVPTDEVEVKVRPEIPEQVTVHLCRAEEAAAQAQRATAQERAERAAAARAAQDAGLTVRDIGAVMGVSFQRAQQVLAMSREQAPPSITPTSTG